MKDKIKISALGLVIGFFSGLFASGGGIIAVICFSHLLKFDEKESRAMSIFCILPIVMASLLIYNSSNLINWRLGILCAIGGVIGGFIGSKMLDKISNKYLELVFIIFLIYSTVRMII